MIKNILKPLFVLLVCGCTATSSSIKKVDGGSFTADKPQIVFYTDFGSIEMELLPDVAPNHVSQVLKLVELGVYDSNHFYRIEPGFVIQTALAHDRILGELTQEQQQAVKKIKSEFSNLKHTRGILSMAREDNDPHSGESSIVILLSEAPHLDGKYTIFGRVISGMDTIDKITAVNIDADKRPLERININKAEVLGK